METLYILGGVFLVLVVYYLFLSKKPIKAALEKQYKDFQLVQKENISHNTLRLRFGFDSPNQHLGLPVGKHLFLQFTDKNGEAVGRAYTPITSDRDIGYMDLVIKIYPDGKMSQHVNAMTVGDSIRIRGPHGHLHYLGNGAFNIARKSPKRYLQELKGVAKLGMIAGGTGITPMAQIMREICHFEEKIDISLLYANVTEDDILLRSELEKYKSERKNVDINFTLDKPSEGWDGYKGFVNPTMIQNHLPGPGEGLILLCGPPPMMKFMEKNLVDLGYGPDEYFIY